jgi:hypothetical protein
MRNSRIASQRSLGLLGILAPVTGHDKCVVALLYALVPVVFGFEKIESYSDIPAFDIAILVKTTA